VRDSLTLTNQNNFTVTLASLTINSTAFTVQASSMLVGPNSSTKIYITFNPVTRITYNGTLTTTTNPGMQVGAVSVTGVGGKKPRGRPLPTSIGSPVPGDGPVTGSGPGGTNLPADYGLSQNYPNPFNPVTTIRYALPIDGYVRLGVFDVLGREVAVPVDGVQEAGYREVTFDATSLPSGIYIYRIVSGTFTDTQKMLLVR
jgi:hypothetical protein